MPRDKEALEKLADKYAGYSETDLVREGVMSRVEELANALYDAYGEEGRAETDRMLENVEEEITGQVKWLLRTILAEQGPEIAETLVRIDAEDGYADQWLDTIARALRSYADKQRGTGFSLLYEDQARKIEEVAA